MHKDVGQDAAMSLIQPLRVHIRWMIRRDMPEVLDIEDESFEFPWFEEDFIRCLRQRNCIGMVAEHDERVVGFMIYELHKTRLHILNFAVATGVSPPRRRRADDRQADRQALAASAARGSRWKSARRTWPAQLFFRANGFRAVSVLHDFYDDTPEDAYLMQYRYQPAPAEIMLPINRITRLAG